MPTLEIIGGKLAERTARVLSPGPSRRAAVAVLLRSGRQGPEVLFIERARRDGDPWSGDIALPGGMVEAQDGGDPRRAAEREALEEVGIDVAQGDLMGRLDDLQAGHLPIIVSCFVYRVGPQEPLRFSEEVAAAFWFPLAGLLDPKRRVETSFHLRGQGLIHPALELLEPGRPLLWGITYRLISQFLEILGHALPAAPAVRSPEIGSAGSPSAR